MVRKKCNLWILSSFSIFSAIAFAEPPVDVFLNKLYEGPCPVEVETVRVKFVSQWDSERAEGIATLVQVQGPSVLDHPVVLHPLGIENKKYDYFMSDETPFMAHFSHSKNIFIERVLLALPKPEAKGVPVEGALAFQVKDTPLLSHACTMESTSFGTASLKQLK